MKEMDRMMIFENAGRLGASRYGGFRRFAGLDGLWTPA